MDGRPTHRGEMQFIFEGCYTNVSDIKAGNRNCENTLFESEFSTLFVGLMAINTRQMNCVISGQW